MSGEASGQAGPLGPELRDDSPLLRLDSADPVEIAVDMAVLIVADAGVDALTLRAVARRQQCSPGSLVARFGSYERLVSIVVFRVVSRWLDDVGRRWEHVLTTGREREGLVALVPDDEDGVYELCVLLRFVGWVRTDPDRAAHLAPFREGLEGMVRISLAHRWGRPAAREEVEAVLGALLGVYLLLTDLHRPMRPAAGRRVVLAMADAVA